MGYLLGAFGKQMAGSNYRSLQARLMKIQSRARRATRDVERMTKMIERQEKMMKNNLTLQAQNINMMTSQKLMQDFGLAGKDYNSLDEEAKKQYMQDYSNYAQMMTQAQAQTSFMQAASQQQIEDYIQNLKDTMLEPLKDEEDLLQSEKDSLESQIAVAKQDYEACKQMEKDGAQMLKPEYTGGGQ